MCRRYGSTGISSPAIRPIDEDQAPAQLNTTRVATSPAEVRTALHPALRDIDAEHLDSLVQARAAAPRRRGIAGGHISGARDSVGRTECAAEHVVDVEHRDHPCRLGRINPSRLGQAGAVPHLHVLAEVLDLLRQREHEEVSQLAKVGWLAGLRLEVLEEPHRQPLQPDVGLHRELLPNSSRALAGGLRTERLAFEQKNVHIAFRQLIGERAAHDAAAHDDCVSGFHEVL